MKNFIHIYILFLLCLFYFCTKSEYVHDETTLYNRLDTPINKEINRLHFSDSLSLQVFISRIEKIGLEQALLPFKKKGYISLNDRIENEKDNYIKNGGLNVRNNNVGFIPDSIADVLVCDEVLAELLNKDLEYQVGDYIIKVDPINSVAIKYHKDYYNDDQIKELNISSIMEKIVNNEPYKLNDSLTISKIHLKPFDQESNYAMDNGRGDYAAFGYGWHTNSGRFPGGYVYGYLYDKRFQFYHFLTNLWFYKRSGIRSQSWFKSRNWFGWRWEKGRVAEHKFTMNFRVRVHGPNPYAPYEDLRKIMIARNAENVMYETEPWHFSIGSTFSVPDFSDWTLVRDNVQGVQSLYGTYLEVESGYSVHRSKEYSSYTPEVRINWKY